MHFCWHVYKNSVIACQKQLSWASLVNKHCLHRSLLIKIFPSHLSWALTKIPSDHTNLPDNSFCWVNASPFFRFFFCQICWHFCVEAATSKINAAPLLSADYWLSVHISTVVLFFAAFVCLSTDDDSPPPWCLPTNSSIGARWCKLCGLPASLPPGTHWLAGDARLRKPEP